MRAPPEPGGAQNRDYEDGEVLIRSPGQFAGYYKQPELTAASFTEDGFFRTGDLFEIAADDQGPRYYRFAGRCKQIIVRGGMKISPEELDAFCRRLANTAVATPGPGAGVSHISA